ncbi:hypothetical protein MACA111363_02770 [Macrococcoides canis]|uniref:Uncharacterized protein n=1 Tax=Macrococcoides canis TaxID=1855823 RepID=A0A1W7ABS6_9STAP|nr:hypothetical protein [Macrococcus canis]ARQ07063.1 hypothetical protein MCCS_14220 [Macrococcus canis]
MIKVRNIKTGKVFDVIKVSGEYWIDETGYIESEQLGITWELIDDYQQLYEHQKQRADEAELIIKDLDNLYLGEKQRADELEKSLNLSIIASGNDTLVKELQKALSESNERADQLEKRLGKLKETLLRYENIPQRIQSFETVLALMNEMERIEMEDNNDI